MAWLLARFPALQIAFIGYAARFAEKKSRKARGLAVKAGVPLAADSQSRQDWRTGVQDGGLWASSIGGQLTGEGFHLMLVDDPVKDRKTAESAVYREQTYDWFTDTAETRLEPEGSCIVTQTRWHEDDLAGRLIRDGWESICLPAINDGTDPRRKLGEALWPERWPIDRLREIEKGSAYRWASLYQGRPMPKGGALFGDAHFYSKLPTGFRVGVGVDLAYSAKTSADYSVAIIGYRDGDTLYVVDVIREQEKAPVFGGRLKKIRETRVGASWRAYLGGTEKGSADFLEADGVDVGAEPATLDKFQRAQPVAAAWNAGKVLLPERAPWLEKFLSEIKIFTGVKDAHDDQVDALAALFDVTDSGSFTYDSSYDDDLPGMRV